MPQGPYSQHFIFVVTYELATLDTLVTLFNNTSYIGTLVTCYIGT